MSVRTAARAAVAHSWRAMKPVLAVMVVWGVVSAGAVLYTSSGRDCAEAAAGLLVVALLVRLLFTRIPNGREVTGLYLELARLIDQHPDGQFLRLEGSDDHVFLRCRNRHIRKILRMDFTTADPPQVDRAGWMPVEEYVLVPISNQVFRLTRGGDIDADGIVSVGARHGLSSREIAKVMWFAVTTSRGFATAGDLRELVRQIREAQPFDPNA